MVWSVNPIWRGRKAEERDDGSRAYTDVYQIVTPGEIVAQRSIGLSPLIPQRGAPHPSDSTALLRARAINQGELPELWFVECAYDTKAPGGQDSNSDPNPLARPPEHQWSKQTVTVAITKDRDGKPVINAAKDPLVDPPLEVEIVIPQLTVTRNVLSFSGAICMEYSDTVNSDPWFGCEPGEARLAFVGARSMQEGDVSFWSMTAEIQFKRGGWQPKVLNAGYRALSANGVPHKILSKDGSELRQPHPLTEDGHILLNGEPNFLDFKVFREVAFGPLGLV